VDAEESGAWIGGNGKNRGAGRGTLGRIVMKNLNFLVAAYVAIWLIFCGYVLSVARRMANLKDDIRRLKNNGK
jgi:CcmD family protein